jgi:hypothetical protein
LAIVRNPMRFHLSGAGSPPARVDFHHPIVKEHRNAAKAT